MHDLKKIQRRIVGLKNQIEALKKDKKKYSPLNYCDLMDIYKDRLYKEQFAQKEAVWNYFKTHENNGVVTISKIFNIPKSTCSNILEGYLTTKTLTDANS